MRLLVTGGAGFIGSNFIQYWLSKYPKDKIVNYDKLTYAGNVERLKNIELDPNYKFIKGDIADRERVNEVIKRAEITHIVNFAAETHVDRSIVGPSAFIQTNILGTYTLLEAALENKVERFHHISTDEVFGALPLGSKEKFTEKIQYNPRSPYSASKAASDHLVYAFYTTYGLPATITNCSNNFGPFQDPEKFLPRAITNLLEGEPIPIYGDGKYVRDWLYVDDHCRAIEAVLRRGEIGETYLVGGTTHDISNLEIAKKLLKIFGRDKSYLRHVKDRPGHDRRYAVDWSKAKNELGWKPQFDFDSWLAKTVDWYKENVWWWEPLKEGAEKLYEKTGQK